MTGFAFTRITSETGPLTKVLSLAADGSIHKEAAAHLSRGHFETVSMAGLDAFASALESATPDVAFAYGLTGRPHGLLVREDDLPGI